MPVRQDRRQFLKTTLVAGIAVYIATPGNSALAALLERENLRPAPWNPKDGSLRYRVDATAKACGDKLFAFDMRARNLPGWPKEQAHAMLVRVTRADRIYAGIDLAILGDELKPDRIVTAVDLARDGLALPAFYGDDMLLPEGKTPAYLGQAVAILVWHDFARYRLAKNTLKFRDDTIRWGAETGPIERDPWAAFRYVRVGGATPFDDDAYSTLKDTVVFPGGYRKQLPQWPEALAGGKLDQQGMAHAQAMARDLDTPPADWLVLARNYATQSIDTAALEPDNANGWYDAANATVHLVVASQSPQEVAAECAGLLAASRIGAKRLVLHPCYTVGYGSKDHAPMPFYGFVASLYGDGRPVRLANDRYEQFQSSLKRHPFTMKYRVAVERKTGKFQIFQADMQGNGGGRCNFSPSVALVAATAAQSIYYFPRNDLASTALATRALDAGSARGYGTLQSMAATEMIVDEIAHELGIDAIDLRLANVLKSGMKNSQGAIPGGALRADEVLAQAREHPLWKTRTQRKADYEAAHPGRRYGIGFACVHKDFGTGAEAAFAQVEVSKDGKIRLRHTAVEIGTGMSSSQAVLCARWFGRPADDVATAETDWTDLPLVATHDPWLMQQAVQDAQEKNPRWTPNLTSPTSASNSAYFFSHATSEAARLVFNHGLWPAALALWRRGFGGGQLAPLAVRREEARWVDGKLTAGGLAPLTLEAIVTQAYALGLVTGATVHTFNRWQWAEAEFPLDGATERLPLDALALRYGDGIKASTPNGYRVIDRSRVFYPPAQRNNAGVTYYSALGTLVELAVERASGKVELLSHHSILECGNQIVPELVSGQLQGGIAMGIGHALHEFLPQYEDGPGNGTWNFNRYTLPRGSDVAVWTQTDTVLPPLSETDPPKGMAEVVMIPIVGAIVNAVHHATGTRFYELPLTPSTILAALDANAPGAKA
ncbi:MAG TPA: molybdopterin cofactor-binding domain-containing protein [Tahibacter sp.]|nr:molybdopterin cofactor-binding domain-containing protein [Tahibacter sp.]